MLKYFYSSLIVIVFLISCSEDTTEAPKTFESKFLHGEYIKLWRLTDKTINGKKVTDPTQLDELMLFNKLNGGMIIYGEIDSQPDDTLTIDNFIFELVNGVTIKISDLHKINSVTGIEEYKIINLKENSLVFEAKLISDKKTNTVRYSYVPAVKTDQYTLEENLFLTKANVKIWKVANTIVNGIEENIPCHRDDLWLFSTNGSGIKLYGDKSCIANDKTNNDFFNWIFSNNNKNIIRSEMKNELTHQNGGKLIVSDTLRVLSLTSEEFKFEVNNSLDGNQRLVIVTMVPYIR